MLEDEGLLKFDELERKLQNRVYEAIEINDIG